MVEPEVAFLEFDGLCDLAEEFVSALVARVLDRCAEDLKVLERDTALLERVRAAVPAHHLHRGDRAAERQGQPDRLGRRLRRRRGDAGRRGLRPAGDGQPLPDRLQGVLHAARPGEPEGRARARHPGARGLRRDHRRQPAHPRPRLPAAAHPRRTTCRSRPSSGTSTCASTAPVPHSGFGMGLERFVAWMCKLDHVRETIPYPRMLYKIYP